MQWFQFRRGVVRESLRVAHHVESIDSEGTVRSWCRLTFQPVQIEEIDDPTGMPLAAESSRCAACELRFEASSEAVRDGGDPVVVHGDASLVTMLRKAQWLLDDAAFYLPEGRCSSEDCELLAATLEQLAALVWERAARCVTIDVSVE